MEAHQLGPEAVPSWTTKFSSSISSSELRSRIDALDKSISEYETKLQTVHKFDATLHFNLAAKRLTQEQGRIALQARLAVFGKVNGREEPDQADAFLGEYLALCQLEVVARRWLDGTERWTNGSSGGSDLTSVWLQARRGREQRLASLVVDLSPLSTWRTDERIRDFEVGVDMAYSGWDEYEQEFEFDHWDPIRAANGSTETVQLFPCSLQDSACDILSNDSRIRQVQNGLPTSKPLADAINQGLLAVVPGDADDWWDKELDYFRIHWASWDKKDWYKNTRWKVIPMVPAAYEYPSQVPVPEPLNKILAQRLEASERNGEFSTWPLEKTKADRLALDKWELQFTTDTRPELGYTWFALVLSILKQVGWRRQFLGEDPFKDEKWRALVKDALRRFCGRACERGALMKPNILAGFSEAIGPGFLELAREVEAEAGADENWYARVTTPTKIDWERVAAVANHAVRYYRRRRTGEEQVPEVPSTAQETPQGPLIYTLRRKATLAPIEIDVEVSEKKDEACGSPPSHNIIVS
jgi:hypothetical protein